MTDWSSIVRPALHSLEPYRPGAAVRELERRYGVSGIVKLNWNESLFDPLPGIAEALEQETINTWRYPEQAYADLKDVIATLVGTTPERIVPGHGAQAMIGALAAVFVEHGDRVVVPAPSYGLYAQVCAAHGAEIHTVPLAANRLDLPALAATATAYEARVVWVCDPNNPTGSLVGRREWEDFLDALPDRCAVIADEAYMDYVPPAERPGRERDVEAGRPVVVIRSFSKLFGLAGLRLGFAIADPELAAYVDVLQEPFNVNRAALAAGTACLADPRLAEERRAEVREARELLVTLLQAGGVVATPSAANFVLFEVGVDDEALTEGLVRRGLLIRAGSEFGMPRHVRITVGPVPLMERVARELLDVRGGLS
ncbi:MAG: pyridoxal phosphate-dependent aminotransferase [Gaiella sp.]